MDKRNISRREFLRATALTAAGAAVVACQPQTVIVEKEVPVTQIVKETVKETVVVAGTPEVVEKEVTKIVEKEVTKVVEKQVEVEVVVTATPELSLEAPMLANLVSSGELPPSADRIPSEPLVLRPVDGVMNYGGTLLYADAQNWSTTCLLNNGLFRWKMPA